VQASPRHVPDLIVVAPELPRTKSNKLVELAVGDVINGREVRNRDALANPLALDWFKQFAL
jgi:acetoacetyl-CoA synthetase